MNGVSIFAPSWLRSLSSSDAGDRGTRAAVCTVHFIRSNNESAMEAALLILALIPLSNAMPLLGLPSGVLMGNYKGIYESDSPAMLRSGRVLASGDQASGVQWTKRPITCNLDLCRLCLESQLPPPPRSSWISL